MLDTKCFSGSEFFLVRCRPKLPISPRGDGRMLTWKSGSLYYHKQDQIQGTTIQVVKDIKSDYGLVDEGKNLHKKNHWHFSSNTSIVCNATQTDTYGNQNGLSTTIIVLVDDGSNTVVVLSGSQIAGIVVGILLFFILLIILILAFVCGWCCFAGKIIKKNNISKYFYV